MDAAIFKMIAKRIESYENEMIEMQKKLISIPAISPVSGGKGEYQKGRYLESLLPKVFDTVTPCHAPHAEAEGGIRPNYAAVLKGKSNEKTIWVMAHMDVVPEGEMKLWNTNPFEAVVKDGKIYGRGSEDNHQAIISGFFAAKAFKDEGVTPPCNVGFLLVSDEENGSVYGAQHILKNHKNLFGKNDVVIVPDTGNATGTEVEVAEKTTLWLKITVHGKQSHGAHPKNGINAHRVAAHIIVKTEELYQTFGTRDHLFAPEESSTIEPTKKLQNVSNVNTIPGEDIVYFDCRLLPSVNTDKFLSAFKATASDVAKNLGATVDVEVEYHNQAAPPTSMDEPIVVSIVKAAKEIYSVEGRPSGTGGNTVAQNFRKEGLPCAVYTRLDEKLHQPNEYCLMTNMVGDAKIWAYAFLDAK